MSNPNRLTTAEVARICRVSDATVKRWASAGLIESEKTNGGHRRFRAEAVAKFQCEKGLGLANQSGDSSILTAPERSRIRKEHGGSDFFNSLICGCEEEAAHQLIRRFLEGAKIEEILDDVLSFELGKIGQLWFEGKISVAQEHLASRTVLYAMYKLRSAVPNAESTQKLAICCCIEGDHHALPADFARLVFESYGWTVLNFGPNSPLFSIEEEVKRIKPDIVCISGAVLEDPDRLSRDFAGLLEAAKAFGCKIIAGGRGFEGDAMRERFPADFFPDNFKELAEIVR